VLVYAETSRVDNGHISLTVIGEPAHDPDNHFEAGQIIENVDLGYTSHDNLSGGSLGLFNFFPEGECGHDQATMLYFVVEEVDGIYLCKTASYFPGVTKTELVPAVLDYYCHDIVSDWGINTECPSYSSCCGGGTAMTAESAGYLVLAGIILVPGRRKRRKRK